MQTFDFHSFSRSGRYQSSLALMLFLLSSVLVLAVLLTVYYRQSEVTVPTEYHFRLDEPDSGPLPATNDNEESSGY